MGWDEEKEEQERGKRAMNRKSGERSALFCSVLSLILRPVFNANVSQWVTFAAMLLML